MAMLLRQPGIEFFQREEAHPAPPQVRPPGSSGGPVRAAALRDACAGATPYGALLGLRAAPRSQQVLRKGPRCGFPQAEAQRVRFFWRNLSTASADQVACESQSKPG